MNKEIQLAIDELRVEIERVIGEKKLMSEELETLRASNTIKQANIELLELNINRLEALNRSFKANEKRLLETARVIRNENAKLIAERDEQIPEGYGKLKDHEIAQAINKLRDVAITYAGTQQLRERIAAIIISLLKPKGEQNV